MRVFLTVFIPVLAGAWTTLVAEKLQEVVTWLDARGPLFKRVGVAAIGVGLTVLALVGAKALERFGVPEPYVKDLLAPIAVGLAYLFHTQDKLRNT